MEMRHSTKA